METLKKKFKRSGFDYEQMEREGDVAMYSQSKNGTIHAYEVFKVIKHKEKEIDGCVISAREAPPKDEHWGTFGFTYIKLDNAIKKYNELKEKYNVDN